MDKSFVESIRDLSLVQAGDGVTDGGVPYAALPAGYTIHALDFEKHQDQPNRKRGTLTVRDVDSFVAYLNKHKTPGTLVLADLTGTNQIRAYLNGHEPEADREKDATGAAGWGDHQIVFEPRWTPGWQAWTKFNGKWVSQEDLAEFLVERVADIAAPDGATLAMVAQSLKLTTNLEYEKVISTDNDDVQLVYKENTKTSVEIPTRFTLVLTPFDGAVPVEIRARLKFAKPSSPGNGAVFMWILGEALRLELDRVFAAMRDEVFAKSGVDVLRGVWA